MFIGASAASCMENVNRVNPPPKSMMHILYLPLFPISKKILNFPPISKKFLNFPPIFVQFTFFWLNLRLFASPYFDHDAFMCHALHALDALDVKATGSIVLTDYEIKQEN